MYREENTFFFHAVKRQEVEIKGAIEGQLVNPYFPVDMSILRSTKHFYDLDFEDIEINDALIRPAPLHHPQEAVAFRIEADGGVFVLATDTEPGSPFHDQCIREIARDADALVYDSQYTSEQLKKERKGWGHSSWLEGTRIANECNVKNLFLFHHDPDHDDAIVDGLVENARKEFKDSIGAAEGMELVIRDSKTVIDVSGVPAREALGVRNNH